MAAESFYIPINRDLFEFYAFYVGVLMLKNCFMIMQVGLSRIYYKAPMNPEDGTIIKWKVYSNENVERNRRAHLNDLENIPFFVIASFLYLLTNPSVEPTQWIIRIYVLTRISHTIAYTILQSVIRIPLFEIGYFINWYLAISVVYHFS